MQILTQEKVPQGSLGLGWVSWSCIAYKLGGRHLLGIGSCAGQSSTLSRRSTSMCLFQTQLLRMHKRRQYHPTEPLAAASMVWSPVAVIGSNQYIWGIGMGAVIAPSLSWCKLHTRLSERITILQTAGHLKRCLNLSCQILVPCTCITPANNYCLPWSHLTHLCWVGLASCFVGLAADELTG